MNLQDMATRLLRDFDAHKPGRVFAGAEWTLSIAEAYELQFEVAAIRESRGERVAGYKIGCISDTMQTQLGIDQPVFGHVWDTEIYRTGVKLCTTNFDELAIEAEIAVRLLDDVPSSVWLRNNPEVVAGQQAVIELHNYVFRGSESKRAVELIANNAIHAGVVIADEKIGSTDFKSTALLQVDRSTERLGEGIAAHLHGGPVDVVAAVSEHLERHGRRLKRDQIVLTGSPLPLWKVTAGDCITVHCDDFPEVSCEVVERS